MRSRAACVYYTAYCRTLLILPQSTTTVIGRQVCGMEMRPARGRAEVIFGRERFRCSRCGAKASSYFNVDDMNDPRAVARLERLKAQEEMDEADVTDDGDDDTADDDEVS